MSANDDNPVAGKRLRLHPVALVGAGPGDPELLTLKAVRAIACADVILVDDLVNPEVLSHARADARIRYVGKRGGCRSTPQAFIERLMVREALAGRRVVRLKGGDPLVFGRAAEEMAALRAKGLEVTIVNGVSSALAAAASLQVSLTNRAHCQAVAFVTGHSRPGGAAPSWSSLVRAGVTLAIYMGVSDLETIVSDLMDAGVSGDCPAAVVQAAGSAHQRCLVSTVALLPAQIRRAGIGSPAIVLIGQVAAEGPKALQPPENTAIRVDGSPAEIQPAEIQPAEIQPAEIQPAEIQPARAGRARTRQPAFGAGGSATPRRRA
jgi:uroporphyrin-III C-methyltransferase